MGNYWKFPVCLLIFVVFCNPICGDNLFGGNFPFTRGNFWHFQSPSLFSKLGPHTKESPDRDREPLGPDFHEPPVLTDQYEKPNPSSPAEGEGGNPNVGTSEDFGEGADSEDDIEEGFFNPFSTGLFGLFSRGGAFGGGMDLRPWWQGKNVCIEREESTESENNDEDDTDDEEDGTTTDQDDDNDDVEQIESNRTSASKLVPKQFHFSTTVSMSNCIQTPTKYECITKVNNHGQIKKLVVRYRCCHGFTRSMRGLENGPGCTTKLDLKPVLKTVAESAPEFLKLIESLHVDKRMATGNYTVFAPNDAALSAFSEKMLETNMIDVSARQRRDLMEVGTLVQRHISPGFVDFNELSNNDLIPSEDKASSIRINIFHVKNFEKVVTANCMKLEKSNIIATNGIVHVIDGVMMSNRQSIQDLIKNNPKLTKFTQALKETDLLEKLAPEGHYTIFAPTDEAFDKLDTKSKEKIFRGDHCAKTVLKHHISPHIICSSILLGNSSVANIDGATLRIQRLENENDDLILEDGAKLTQTDLIATNGVVHLIDSIIFPESAMDIGDVLQNHNLTKFSDLVKKANIDLVSMKNYTILAPNNRVFNQSDAKKVLEEIENDPKKLRQFVEYHLVEGRLESCHMKNNGILPTKRDGETIRLNFYSTLPFFTNVINRGTANCARITGYDAKACNAAIHEVSHLLVPPQMTIMERIRADPQFSELADILYGTETEKLLRQSNATLTFLAPTNDVIQALPMEKIRDLMGNKEKADKLLGNHVMREIVCCEGVGGHGWNFVDTVAGKHVSLGRYDDGHQVRFGSARVTNCDLLATNGVIHTVDRVLYPQRSTFPNLGGLFLFNF